MLLLSNYKEFFNEHFPPIYLKNTMPKITTYYLFGKPTGYM